MIKTSDYKYHHGEQTYHAYLAYDDQTKTPRPVVLVAHDWSGRNSFACDKAELLAQMGYVGFAVDMYGSGQLGETTAEKQALIEPLMTDRRLLRARILAAFDAATGLPEADKTQVAAIGFCFGGLCVLDLARSGVQVNGVVSFHGLLHKPEQIRTYPIHAKVLALHGYDDPMVKPEVVAAFATEMSEASVDWQIHMYGQVKHAFTNPLAHDAAMGLIYDKQAEKRAMQSMTNFLGEIFSGR